MSVILSTTYAAGPKDLIQRTGSEIISAQVETCRQIMAHALNNQNGGILRPKSEEKGHLCDELKAKSFIRQAMISAGSFSVSGYALTFSGEELLDYITGRDSDEIWQESRRRILQSALDHTTRTNGLLEGRVKLDDSVGDARRAAFFKNLRREGFLEEAFIDAGGMQLAGYAMTAQGERELDRLDGRNSEVLEEDVKRRIMLRLLKMEESENGREASMDSTPFAADMGKVGKGRMRTLLEGLANTGYLKACQRSSGAFLIAGFYRLTPEGKEAAMQIESAPELPERALPSYSTTQPRLQV